MTSYTTPHSLPTYEAEDLIADSIENLRTKINAVSTAANTALTAEGARAEAAAESYADGLDSTNRSAWAAADAAKLAEAKTYADQQDDAHSTEDRAYTDTQVAGAKAETDARLGAVETHNTAQDARLTSVETVNTGQDGRLGAVEAVNTAQDITAINNKNAAKDYADALAAQLETKISTTHVALDVDGTPFVLTGARSVKVLQDTDGTPYYEAA